MSKEKQIEEMAECCPYFWNGDCTVDAAKPTDCDLMCEMFGFMTSLANAGYRKQSEDERFEAVDMFRNLITNKFIELCNYNDYGKINLLLIGETIDRIYDDVVAKMKGGAE
jgi:hypothetical protein